MHAKRYDYDNTAVVWYEFQYFLQIVKDRFTSGSRIYRFLIKFNTERARISVIIPKGGIDINAWKVVPFHPGSIVSIRLS